MIFSAPCPQSISQCFAILQNNLISNFLISACNISDLQIDNRSVSRTTPSGKTHYAVGETIKHSCRNKREHFTNLVELEVTAQCQDTSLWNVAGSSIPLRCLRNAG